jgi:putative membrane protein
MGELYLWLKSLHIVAVIAWMAGLFYLPRLYVYHAATEIGGAISEQFKVMERRLTLAIMRPAGITAWAAGLATAWVSGDLSSMPAWLAVKLALVVGLTAFHLLLEYHGRNFQSDIRYHGQRYYRLINEVPTVLLIAIVVMVVVRPF